MARLDGEAARCGESVFKAKEPWGARTLAESGVARGRWERACAVEPKEGTARARLQGEGREKGQAGQKPGKETLF